MLKIFNKKDKKRNIKTLINDLHPEHKNELNKAVKKSKKEGRYLSEVLFENTVLSDSEALKILSKHFRMRTVYLHKKVISPISISMIPKEISEKFNVVVFKKNKDIINVAVTSPENEQIIDFIKKKTECKVKLFLTTPNDIKHALNRYKSEINEDFEVILDYSTKETLALNEPVEKLAQFVPIIRMVDKIIDQAILKGASDVHIEPFQNRVIIRLRIDGILHNIVELPKEILPPLIARIKILSKLKIDEHMMPQDGRFHHKYKDQDIAIRVSVIPTLFGAKVAMRLLEMKEKMFTLKKLGLNKKDTGTIKQAIGITQGMILVTGPTGSGKTTTLYTLLQMLNQPDVNICTIEDPIEYGIDSINQMQIKPQVGLTFAEGLRALLRQDPNILMVGEIRDLETANIAINAALTGHLVLSTLHTNSAYLAPQRLIEMGVKPYLVSSVVNMIIGQRLVRKLCPSCKKRMRITDNFIEKYNSVIDFDKTFNKFRKSSLISKEHSLNSSEIYKNTNCSRCGQTGYKGRVGIYEILKMNDKIKKSILDNGSELEIKNLFEKQGSLTMADDGFLKVLNGATTIEELVRVIQE